MDPAKRVLIQVKLPRPTSDKKAEATEAKATAQLVEQLMGRKAEKRFAYIQENARFVDDVDV